MSYEIDKTKFKHKKFGEGVLRRIDGSILYIEFPTDGEIKFLKDSVEKGLLIEIVDTKSVETVLNDTMSNYAGKLRQYDSSDDAIGGKNVIEAFKSDDIVIFNESYTVIGEETSAKKISATYDLTIIGDVTVDELIVNGELTVIGNITAKSLNCANTLICQGNVNVDELYVGAIVAKSIKCVKFVCDSNALIETTIDIDESSRTEKTMVACEGIYGQGSFEALNAIANDFFEFDGEIQGKVLELVSDTTFSEIMAPEKVGVDLSELEIVDVIKQIEERLKVEYEKCRELEEDSVIELTRLLDNRVLHNISDYSTIFDVLTNISYQDELDDFGDYLMVKYAKKILPESIYRYETIEHIDTLMLPKAEKTLDELEFAPKSIERIAQAIKIAVECSESIPMDINDVLDKIFSSIGLRYSTVKNILGKSTIVTPVKEKKVVECVTEDNTEEVYVDFDEPKQKKFKMSKSQFLSMSIQAEAKFFGITVDEQQRLASARIKTCEDFLRMTEQDLREIFKKKLFLANHLYLAQQKMKAAVDEMDDE